MALNDRQQRFCDEYLIDLNATQAYLRAGYCVKERTAAVNALRLLAKPEVQEYIQRRQQELQRKTGITQVWVLDELYRVAAANASDFVRVEGQGSLASVVIAPTAQIPVEKLAALAGIKEGHNGIEIKLHNKVRALELLGKHLGLFDSGQRDSDDGLLPRLIGGLKDE